MGAEYPKSPDKKGGKTERQKLKDSGPVIARRLTYALEDLQKSHQLTYIGVASLVWNKYQIELNRDPKTEALDARFELFDLREWSKMLFRPEESDLRGEIKEFLADKSEGEPLLEALKNLEATLGK